MAASRREAQTFAKNTLKLTEKELKLFEKLCKKAFACKEDALHALRDYGNFAGQLQNPAKD